jgi:hypothetical protein
VGIGNCRRDARGTACRCLEGRRSHPSSLRASWADGRTGVDRTNRANRATRRTGRAREDESRQLGCVIDPGRDLDSNGPSRRPIERFPLHRYRPRSGKECPSLTPGRRARGREGERATSESETAPHPGNAFPDTPAHFGNRGFGGGWLGAGSLPSGRQSVRASGRQSVRASGRGTWDVGRGAWGVPGSGSQGVRVSGIKAGGAQFEVRPAFGDGSCAPPGRGPTRALSRQLDWTPMSGPGGCEEREGDVNRAMGRGRGRW